MNLMQKAHILTDAVFERRNSGNLDLFKDEGYVAEAYSDFAYPGEVWRLLSEHQEFIQQKAKDLWKIVHQDIDSELWTMWQEDPSICEHEFEDRVDYSACKHCGHIKE